MRYLSLFAISALLLTHSLTYADANKANMFATQAGSIAGAAQACGQDISEFTNRVNLALTILANTTTEMNEATQTYQGYLQLAAQKQSQGTSGLNCLQIIKDYNSLPIMQSDYENTVLAQMRQTENKPVTFLPSQEPMPPQKVPTVLGVPNSIPDPKPGVSAAPPVATVPAMPGSIINTPAPIQSSNVPTSIPSAPTQFSTPNNTTQASTQGLGYSTPSTQVPTN